MGSCFWPILFDVEVEIYAHSDTLCRYLKLVKLLWQDVP